MTHVIEPAASGRSRCRGCGKGIARDDLRFGEGLPNPYADDGDVTIWYHLKCGAYRRPEPFLLALERAAAVPDSASLEAAARFSLAHRRVCRIGRVERAVSGRARCRACRRPILRRELRIPLLYHEEGMFNASGFVHLTCAPEYFETPRLLDCVRHFGSDVNPVDLRAIEAVLT